MAELVEGNSEEVYYWSEQDISDTDTYYSEGEEISCGFKRDTSSSSDSDRDISDGELKSKFPVEGLGCHDMEKALGRQTFDRKDTLNIYPEEQKQHLQKHHPEILQDLEALHKDGATVAYVSPSVAADLQPTPRTRLPNDVVGDVCVFNTHKPVMIFTLTSSDKRTSKVIKHNSKTARAFRGVDTASTTLKKENPVTLSFKVPHEEEKRLWKITGCHLEDPDSDLECDGVLDDNKENCKSLVNTDDDEQNNISPSTRGLNQRIKDKTPFLVYKSSKNKPLLKPLETTIYVRQNQNLDTNTVCEDSFNSESPRNDNDTVICDKPSNWRDNIEILQQVNHKTCPEVEHDVLRDISVISAALTREEWKTPEVFRRKVQDLEALAREVELPESLDMGPGRYARVVRSFFDRVSAAQRLTTPHTK